MTRTLRVGATEYVWAVISETSGQDLTETTAELADLPVGTRPSADDWAEPDQRAQPSLSSLRLARLATPTTPGSRWIWARLNDSPERVILRVGSYEVR